MTYAACNEILNLVLDNLFDGVFIWELDQTFPLDHKRMQLRYANKAAQRMTVQNIEKMYGSAIKDVFPIWTAKGLSKRFVQAYYNQERQIIFEDTISFDGFSAGFYIIHCYPSFANCVMVTFKRTEIPKTSAFKVYSIDTLEHQTLMLLGHPKIKMIPTSRKRAASADSVNSHI